MFYLTLTTAAIVVFFNSANHNMRNHRKAISSAARQKRLIPTIKV